MESRRPLEGLEVAEGALGIAPELVEKVLDSVVKRIGRVASIARIAARVREKLVTSGSIGRIGTAPDLCYLAVDSSYTSPPLELVGGYLGIVFVASVMYGRSCRHETSGVELSAYVTYDPTRDLTRLEARLRERERAREALRRKSSGEIHFDVLVLDGEVIPRISPRMFTAVGGEPNVVEEIIRRTDNMVLLAEKTGTPVLGVLKRSYSKDALAVLERDFAERGLFSKVKLSDRAFFTYVLEPGELFVLGDYEKITSAYEHLVEEYGEAFPREYALAKYRLRWFKYMKGRTSAASKMRMALYRPSAGFSSAAVKVEYCAAGLSDEEIVSSAAAVSEATGFPAPVDYADALSQIPGDARFTVYQLVLQRIGERNPEVAEKLFSLVNPQKLNTIGLRT